MNRTVSRLLWIALSLAIAWIVLGVAINSYGYFADYDRHPFVIDKGAIAHHRPWKLSLLIHAVGGVLCLVACFLQFSKRVVRRRPWLHRLLGGFFATLMLVFVIPTGMYLALYAIGGLMGTIGFLFLSFLSLSFTLLGLDAYRKGRIKDHSAWMIRAFAMASTAVTFRYLHMFLGMMAMPQITAYLVSLWGSILFNYLLAELLIVRLPKRREEDLLLTPANV